MRMPMILIKIGIMLIVCPIAMKLAIKKPPFALNQKAV
jgi:hypothetical protein